MTDIAQPDITSLTVELLSVYLTNHTVTPAELVELVRATRAALSEPTAQLDAVPLQLDPTAGSDNSREASDAVSAPKSEPDPSLAEGAAPAVPTRKPGVAIEEKSGRSVAARHITVEESLANPDYIISLIDGKPYKAIKRHLARHGLTPEAYRERYNLPFDYPMTAPTLSERRSEIAREMKLSRWARRGPGKTPASYDAVAPEQGPVSPKPDTKPKVKPTPAARKSRDTSKTSASPASVSASDDGVIEGREIAVRSGGKKVSRARVQPADKAAPKPIDKAVLKNA